MSKTAKLPPLPGEKLTTAELEEMRRMLDGMDSIEAVTPEMRQLIESQWPDLAARLPPK